MDARTKKIVQELDRLYPEPKPFLQFTTPFEALVAVILSAQCTDARVNMVTPALFRAANTPEKMARLGVTKLMPYIHATGFFRAKAKNIVGMAEMLLSEFDGEVPKTLDELQKLPGVGRKTASVVLSQVFETPAFPVDRHVLRVANRLGLAQAKTPEKTDLQLRKNISKKLWIPLHMQLISHGRAICRPKPKCRECTLLPYCPEGQKRIKTGAYQKK